MTFFHLVGSPRPSCTSKPGALPKVPPFWQAFSGGPASGPEGGQRRARTRPQGQSRGADLARSEIGGGVGRGSPRGWARSGVGADWTCNVRGFFVCGRPDPPFSTLLDPFGDPAGPTTPRHDCLGGVADPRIRISRVPRVVQEVCDGVFRVLSPLFGQGGCEGRDRVSPVPKTWQGRDVVQRS